MTSHGAHLAGSQVRSDVHEPLQVEVCVVYSFTMPSIDQRNKLVLLAQWQADAVAKAISDGEQRDHVHAILARLLQGPRCRA